MRKLMLMAAALLVALQVFAVPAKKGVFTARQPDGTTVRLERHGDEFFNWTTLAGTSQVVRQSADGYWRPATLDPSERALGRERRARANRMRAAGRATHNTDPMTHGERRIPVLLVEFTDVHFSIQDPASRFSALLNQHNYSSDGATGSVQDFYLDNSEGQFKPVFDVYGPVPLPHDMKYYGEAVYDPQTGKKTASDIRAELALYHGCQALDSVIDFSRYDYDNDGRVDMTLFYYAGYNTAEGASEDAIWPHQWYMSGSSDSEARNARFDGKRVDRYFCTSELQGVSGAKMCGIGTTCHEFGHSLGLPDFYDTDDDDNGTNAALFDFSTMCGGSYNNGGRTPPWFGTEERIILGWMGWEDVREITVGNHTLLPIQEGTALKSETGTEGEYFLYECRSGAGWDAYIPKGLLVYHVDKSRVRTLGGLTPYELWNSTNSINCYGDHPCFYVIPSADPLNLMYRGNMSSCVFPGTANVRQFIPTDWEGNNLSGLILSGIEFSDGKVLFNASFSQEKQLLGHVRDLTGSPVSGVYVKLSAPASPASAQRSVRNQGPRSTEYEALTNEYGDFMISLGGYEQLSAHLTLSKSGYRTTGFDVSLTDRINRVDLQLARSDQGAVNLISYYDPDGEIYYYGVSGENSLMAAIRITPEELPAGGGVLSYVDFPPVWQADSYYIIVDEGGERIYTYAFQPEGYGRMQRITMDVPVTGQDELYVGIAVQNAQPSSGYDGYLFAITEGDGHCHLSEFNLTQSNWGRGYYALILDACIIERADVPDDPEADSFAALGIPCIADPQNGVYAPGSNISLELELPEGFVCSSVKWEFDGRDVTGAKSVSLTAGEHLLVASVKWADGSLETLSLRLDVK